MADKSAVLFLLNNIKHLNPIKRGMYFIKIDVCYMSLIEYNWPHHSEFLLSKLICQVPALKKMDDITEICYPVLFTPVNEVNLS